MNSGIRCLTDDLGWMQVQESLQLFQAATCISPLNVYNLKQAVKHVNNQPDSDETKT